MENPNLRKKDRFNTFFKRILCW